LLTEILFFQLCWQNLSRPICGQHQCIEQVRQHFYGLASPLHPDSDAHVSNLALCQVFDEESVRANLSSRGRSTNRSSASRL